VRVYVDSSALLKRVLTDPGAHELETTLRERAREGAALVSSSLGWIEVGRALRAHLTGTDDGSVNDWFDAALSGILERPIDSDVVALARRLTPPVLRSLDAIHLATALLTDVDVLVAYDLRLLRAAGHHGLRTASPAS
jgi:predicted nucleic acid-binding protein